MQNATWKLETLITRACGEIVSPLSLFKPMTTMGCVMTTGRVHHGRKFMKMNPSSKTITAISTRVSVNIRNSTFPVKTRPDLVIKVISVLAFAHPWSAVSALLSVIATAFPIFSIPFTLSLIISDAATMVSTFSWQGIKKLSSENGIKWAKTKIVVLETNSFQDYIDRKLGARKMCCQWKITSPLAKWISKVLW